MLNNVIPYYHTLRLKKEIENRNVVSEPVRKRMRFIQLFINISSYYFKEVFISEIKLKCQMHVIAIINWQIFKGF